MDTKHTEGSSVFHSNARMSVFFPHPWRAQRAQTCRGTLDTPRNPIILDSILFNPCEEEA
jgi:hypothetical protein